MVQAITRGWCADEFEQSSDQFHRNIRRVENLMACDKCVGFGVWAVGMPVPMEENHFNEGQPNKPCPECGSGKKEEKSDEELAYELEVELFSETRCYDIPMELKVKVLCNVINKVVAC